VPPEEFEANMGEGPKVVVGDEGGELVGAEAETAPVVAAVELEVRGSGETGPVTEARMEEEEVVEVGAEEAAMVDRTEGAEVADVIKRPPLTERVERLLADTSLSWSANDRTVLPHSTSLAQHHPLFRCVALA
jgi:hypothetical protein